MEHSQNLKEALSFQPWIPPIQSEKAIQNRFSDLVRKIKADGNYRFFQLIDREPGSFPKGVRQGDEGKRPVKVWCSNDYLGMGQHPQVLKSAGEALTSGAGSGGSRNISGSSPVHQALEQEMADLHKKESALLFTSGYVANDETLGCMGKLMPELIFLSDEKNHRSLIEGMRRSKCKKVIFKHNDVKDLEEKLSRLPSQSPKVIVFESVYSMDGDISPISDFCRLAKKYGALTYLDESHSVGVYGKTGGGLAEALGCQQEVSIIQAGFGKGYGSTGGYIAGEKNLIDGIRLTAPGFIFTTSLPPSVVAASLESVRHLRHSQEERKRLFQQVKKLREVLKSYKVPLFPSQSHITPVKVGGALACRFVSDDLIQRCGLYLQPINFPSVPKGTERLRVTISASHTDEDIEELGQCLAESFRRAAQFGILNQSNLCQAV